MDSSALLSKGIDSSNSGDSDEEMVVHKKTRIKSILRGSDSEEEIVSFVEGGIVTDADHDNDNKENIFTPKNRKNSRIRRALLDSDDSDQDDTPEKMERKIQVPENLDGANSPPSFVCELDVRSSAVKSKSKKESNKKWNNCNEAKSGSVSSEDELHVEFPLKKSKSKKHKAVDFALETGGLLSDDAPFNDCQLDLPKEKNKKKSSKKVRDFEGEEAKSQCKRRIEKESKKTRVIRNQNKEKKPMREELAEVPPIEDRGCLLADNDLYDQDLGEDMNCNSDNEEESLDAIRAAVKSKMNKQKVRDLDSYHDNYSQDFDEEKEGAQRNKRTERKAARLSKEAIKQMHSETQRMIRESSLALPYHLPEPKTIHDFFKRRARPACQGSAMQLLKSSKYQAIICDERIDPLNNLCSGNPCEPTPLPVPAYPQVDTDGPDLVPASAAVSVNEVTSPHNVLKQSTEINCNKNKLLVSHTAVLADSENQSVNTAVQEQNSEVDGVQNSQKFKYESALQNVLPETVAIVSNPEGEGTASNQEAKTESRDSMLTNTLLESEVREKARKSKMDRLREMGVNFSIKPRLCPDDGAYVDLDGPQPNKELEELKKRFLKHSLTKVKPQTERKITLNVVRKERTADGNEELRMDLLPVTIAAETLVEDTHRKPGEKLQELKAKLQEAMKLRRNDERQKRQALFKLDNEDGFEEEEEEEMTDDSEEEDCTKENVEFLLGEAEEYTCDGDAVEDGDKETDRESVDGWVPAQYNDCVPAPRPMDSEGTLMLFKDSSSKMGDCPAEDKSKLDDDDSLLLPPLNKNSYNGSFELIGSMIPSYQPCNGHPMRGGSVSSVTGGFRSPSPGHFKASFISSASKSSGKTSEPSLPVEDSMDLYNASPEPKNSYLGTEESQFQFSLEDDTQSQLLDADGYLNVGHNRNKFHSSKQRLILDTMDENAMDANMGELLDLCTGQFGGSQVENMLNSCSKGKKDMDELLNLCSGKFITQADSSTQASSLSSKEPKEIDIEDPMAEAVTLCSGSFLADRREEREEEDVEEAEEEFDDFKLLPDDDKGLDSEEEEVSASEEESDAGEEEELHRSEDEEELLLKRQGKKRKLKMQDFLEDEAELSGSDAGSGDEFEGEDDEYEEELLDEDLPSNEELLDQVNKIHRKVLMDDDKRQLRFYQERYLADGDLHSDGPGRLRRFRWKNLDDASQMDLFRGDSENDEEGHHEDLDETEAKYRKERFEREQWLRQQENSGKSIEEAEEEIGEDSQFMKLAKKVTAKTLQRKASTAALESEHALPNNPFEPFKCTVGPRTMKTGSLLNKPKEVLQKLTAMSDLNLNAPRNTRNFVFQALSPTKKDDEVKTNIKPQVHKKISAVASAPTPKRARLEKPSSSKSSRSIFPFLES